MCGKGAAGVCGVVGEPGLTGGCAKGLVERGVLAAHDVGGEVAVKALAGSLSHPGGECWLVPECIQCVAQGGRVVWCGDQSGDAVLVDMAGAASNFA